MKDDLIRRQAVVNTVFSMLCRWDTEDPDDLKNMLLLAFQELPAADAVPVVRCGECKHMTADGRCLEFADDCLRPSASDFCSKGERENDE